MLFWQRSFSELNIPFIFNNFRNTQFYDPRHKINGIRDDLIFSEHFSAYIQYVILMIVIIMKITALFYQ